MFTIKQIILWIFILQVVWIATAEKHGEGHRRSKNSTLAQKQLKKFQDHYHRLENGQSAKVNSMCLFMASDSDSYYALAAVSYALNFSPYCFVTNALTLTNGNSPPPILYTEYYQTVFCPGNKCDINYHYQEVYFNANPQYSLATHQNDIAIVKTKGQVLYDTKCRDPPLDLAWISCDKDGPPANYTDCYMASYGNTNTDVNSTPEDISVNKLQVKSLSTADCAKKTNIDDFDTFVKYYVPDNEICIQTLDGLSGLCQFDAIPFLFCKYWGKTDKTGWGSRENSWTSNDKSSTNNGWGWKPQQKQNLLAVGHVVYSDTDSGCVSETGVNFVLKYGATAYRDLFSKCGYYCSSDLKPGFRCKGNPPKELGPVYCYPEKIPNQGWGSDKPSGWRPSD